MHISRFLSVLPFLLLAGPATLPAQGMGSSSDEVAHIGGPQTKNVRYTLTRTSTIVQTLTNGATITRTFTVKSACDSEGRLYSETHLTTPIGLVHYIVFDPVARTNSNWDNRTKIAIVTHIPAQASEVDTARQLQAVRKPRHVTREDLGVRTIADVEARGTRTTLVVPVGEVGNDQPFTIVTDDWISARYQMPLLTIHDDPRSGKRTDEVTEFQPDEPDPALFKIPEGYTVRERTADHPD
jgi:hypothetical protein